MEEKYCENQRRLIEIGNPPKKNWQNTEQTMKRLERLVACYEEMTREGGREAGENPWDVGVLRYLRSVGHACRRNYEN